MSTATFLQRLSTILAALAALVAARLLHHPTLARQIVPLWTYITHLSRRVERAFTHPPRPRPARPRPVHTSRATPDPSGENLPPSEQTARRPRWHLPTSQVWLIRVLGYQGAGYASQLRYLLAEPGAQALLAACPVAQRRLVPLVRILIPPQWGLPFPCAQRPAPKPCASPSVPIAPEKRSREKRA